MKLLKYNTFLRKTLVLYIICSKCENNKKEELTEILKDSWFNWKYIFTLKLCLKKSKANNLDWKINKNQEIISLKK